MIFDDLKLAIEEELTGPLGREAQQRVTLALAAWFVNTRKRPVPDLADRLNAWSKKFAELATLLTVEFDGNKFGLKANGTGAATLMTLKFGSDWFVGLPEVEKLILAAVFNNDECNF